MGTSNFGFDTVLFHFFYGLAQVCASFFCVWYSFVPTFFHRFHLFSFFFEVNLNLKKQLNSGVFLEKNNRSFFQNALFLLAQTVSVGQKRWHSLCQTSIMLQASKPLALPGVAMELQACFPYALFCLTYEFSRRFLVKTRN
ncbi:MAG: hypothetical protein WBF39_12875 [Planococcus donghaensis]